MKKIRMDDIWQKLVANIIGIKIREELPKELGKYNIINEKKVSDVIGNGAKVQFDKIIILDIDSRAEQL